MKRLILIILLTFILSSQPTSAETSKEYALMGSKAWSAFECTVLASYGKKPEAEQERLFTLGYDAGITFLQAFKEGKNIKEDLYNQLPIAFLLSLRGPNNDFILGRVYEMVAEDAVKDIIDIAKSDVELKKILADDKFFKKNCHLIK